MGNNSVVIASTACFLVSTLCGLLRESGFRVIVTNNDVDLIHNINTVIPHYIFIEHCFKHNNTDNYVKTMIDTYKNLHVVMWTASDLSANAMARFFYAGAESFFTLRDKSEKILTIFQRLLMGKKYCPDEVMELLQKEKRIPIFNKELSLRENEILKLIDKSDREIADTLLITLKTVDYHKAKMLKKLGMKSKPELAMYATKHKLINDEEVTNEQ